MIHRSCGPDGGLLGGYIYHQYAQHSAPQRSCGKRDQSERPRRSSGGYSPGKSEEPLPAMTLILKNRDGIILYNQKAETGNAIQLQNDAA